MSEVNLGGSQIIRGKWTMKDPYTRTRFISVRARGVIDLFRPFTLLAPFIVSASIMVASLIHGGGTIPSNWWATVGQASFTIAVVNAASNSLNQATDVEADKISKPYRPIPKGIVKPAAAFGITNIPNFTNKVKIITP